MNSSISSLFPVAYLVSISVQGLILWTQQFFSNSGMQTHSWDDTISVNNSAVPLFRSMWKETRWTFYSWIFECFSVSKTPNTEKVLSLYLYQTCFLNINTLQLFKLKFYTVKSSVWMVNSARFLSARFYMEH